MCIQFIRVCARLFVCVRTCMYVCACAGTHPDAVGLPDVPVRGREEQEGVRGQGRPHTCHQRVHFPQLVLQKGPAKALVLHPCPTRGRRGLRRGGSATAATSSVLQGAVLQWVAGACSGLHCLLGACVWLTASVLLGRRLWRLAVLQCRLCWLGQPGVQRAPVGHPVPAAGAETYGTGGWLYRFILHTSERKRLHAAAQPCWMGSALPMCA